MTRRWVVTGCALLAACGSGVSYHRTPDWAYINFPGIQPTLIHEFAPSPGRFAGTCAKDPTFLVLDAGWPAGAKRIDLTTGTDKLSFDNIGIPANALALLPASIQGEDDEAAGQRRIEALLTNARAPITVATDNGWRRAVPAGPEIGKFIAACRAWRKDHPATPS